MLPISDKQLEYAKRLYAELRALEVRAELFSGTDTLSKRIVQARELGVSEFAIIGKKEEAGSSVALRQRGGSQETLSWGEVTKRAAYAYAPAA